MRTFTRNANIPEDPGYVGRSRHLDEPEESDTPLTVTEDEFGGARAARRREEERQQVYDLVRTVGLPYTESVDVTWASVEDAWRLRSNYLRAQREDAEAALAAAKATGDAARVAKASAALENIAQASRAGIYAMQQLKRLLKPRLTSVDEQIMRSLRAELSTILSATVELPDLVLEARELWRASQSQKHTLHQHSRAGLIPGHLPPGVVDAPFERVRVRETYTPPTGSKREPTTRVFSRERWRAEERDPYVPATVERMPRFEDFGEGENALTYLTQAEVEAERLLADSLSKEPTWFMRHPRQPEWGEGMLVVEYEDPNTPGNSRSVWEFEDGRIRAFAKGALLAVDASGHTAEGPMATWAQTVLLYELPPEAAAESRNRIRVATARAQLAVVRPHSYPLSDMSWKMIPPGLGRRASVASAGLPPRPRATQPIPLPEPREAWIPVPPDEDAAERSRAGEPGSREEELVYLKAHYRDGFVQWSITPLGPRRPMTSGEPWLERTPEPERVGWHQMERRRARAEADAFARHQASMREDEGYAEEFATRREFFAAQRGEAKAGGYADDSTLRRVGYGVMSPLQTKALALASVLSSGDVRILSEAAGDVPATQRVARATGPARQTSRWQVDAGDSVIGAMLRYIDRVLEGDPTPPPPPVTPTEEQLADPTCEEAVAYRAWLEEAEAVRAAASKGVFLSMLARTQLIAVQKLLRRAFDLVNAVSYLLNAKKPVTLARTDFGLEALNAARSLLLQAHRGCSWAIQVGGEAARPRSEWAKPLEEVPVGMTAEPSGVPEPPPPPPRPVVHRALVAYAEGRGLTREEYLAALRAEEQAGPSGESRATRMLARGRAMLELPVESAEVRAERLALERQRTAEALRLQREADSGSLAAQEAERQRLEQEAAVARVEKRRLAAEKGKATRARKRESVSRQATSSVEAPQLQLGLPDEGYTPNMGFRAYEREAGAQPCACPGCSESVYGSGQCFECAMAGCTLEHGSPCRKAHAHCSGESDPSDERLCADCGVPWAV